jgi:6-phosphogluconolactonase
MKATNIFILFLFFVMTVSCTSTSSKETYVYFGTYTKESSEGIYVSKLNTETGELSSPKLAAQIDNPSFVALHPSGNFLYSVVEVSGKAAVVVAFAVGDNGILTKLNEQATKGDYPCHLSVDASSKTLLVANYNGATCASYPLSETGQIGEGHIYRHKGSSVHPRQKAPHIHSINVDPANKRVFVADLGLDQIVIYNFDSSQAKLSKHGSIKMPAGGGPRHFSFHPSGKFAYSNLELTREVVAMSYDENAGTLKQLEVHSTLPLGAKAEGSTAECLVHPSGKWLYISNRGHNSIAVFAINQKTGRLTKVEIEPTLGKIPRGFGIDPSGHFLIAGHQNSDKVVVFRINQDTGALQYTGHSLGLNKVVNVRFLNK